MSIQTRTRGRIPAWSIGDRLRKAREEAGLTQGELGRQLGIERKTVSNYEVGTSTPKRPVIIAWALLCETDLEWLETGRGVSPDGERDTNFGYNSNRSAYKGKASPIRRLAPCETADATWSERAA